MQEYRDHHRMRTVIVGGRQSGKTTRLIELANLENAPIVAATRREAEELRRRGASKTLVATESLRGLRGFIAVDDAVRVLEELLNNPVALVTVDVNEPAPVKVEAGALGITKIEPEDRDEYIAAAREAVQMYRDENERLRTYLLAALGLSCGCDHFNGPDRDCPLHGDEDATNPEHWRRPPVPLPPDVPYF